MNTSLSKKLLKWAGGLSLAVAVFQAVITFSPSWSLYFGAPEELVSNPPVLYAAGLVAAAVFAIFGFYGLSGAGYLRPLPLLRWGLPAIGGVYILRGATLIPQVLTLAGVIHLPEAVTPQGVMSSLVSLCIGLLYLAGTVSGWGELKVGKKSGKK